MNVIEKEIVFVPMSPLFGSIKKLLDKYGICVIMDL